MTKLITERHGNHRYSVYGQIGWDGHKNDAEIRALYALPTLPTNLRGTAYFVGTGGVCDGCKQALKEFRQRHVLIQVKVLYITEYELSVLQDNQIKYGWKDAKPATIKGSPFFHYYLPAVDYPDPLNLLERQSLFYGRTMTIEKLKRGVTLRQCQVEIPNLQLRKRAEAALQKEIRSSLWRVEVGGNIWGERRRFAHEDAGAARTAVLALKNFNQIEILEFDRQLQGATQGAYGNWTPQAFHRSPRIGGHRLVPQFGDKLLGVVLG
jgi:hypothetical protein